MRGEHARELQSGRAGGHDTSGGRDTCSQQWRPCLRQHSASAWPASRRTPLSCNPRPAAHAHTHAHVCTTCGPAERLVLVVLGQAAGTHGRCVASRRGQGAGRGADERGPQGPAHVGNPRHHRVVGRERGCVRRPSHRIFVVCWGGWFRCESHCVCHGWLQAVRYGCLCWTGWLRCDGSVGCLLAAPPRWGWRGRALVVPSAGAGAVVGSLPGVGAPGQHLTGGGSILGPTSAALPPPPPPPPPSARSLHCGPHQQRGLPGPPGRRRHNCQGAGAAQDQRRLGEGPGGGGLLVCCWRRRQPQLACFAFSWRNSLAPSPRVVRHVTRCEQSMLPLACDATRVPATLFARLALHYGVALRIGGCCSRQRRRGTLHDPRCGSFVMFPPPLPRPAFQTAGGCA